ncbi:MAG: peptidylprolyl isomerase [Ignavibacteria bacterium]|nr:peptidylprolyl isomerase [Ignavibacteria bacterium]
MSFLVALLLGVIQGLTEFIPISSTAHLTIAGSLLGTIDPNNPESWTAFIATIQLGTLVAVTVFFRRDIISMSKHFFVENFGSGRLPVKDQSRDSRMTWFVIAGTVPVVAVGLAFKDLIEGSLTKDLHIIASSLIVVAILLWIAERKATFTRTSAQLNFLDAMIIGFAQVLALIPGSSRSGTTIMAGLFRGLTREHAARFSFLLSIPAILGSGILEFAGEVSHLNWEESGAALLIATLASMISGYWSIAFLLRYLRTRNMNAFIIYRIALGAALLLTACSSDTGQREGTDIAREMSPPYATVDSAANNFAQTPADTSVITDVVDLRTSAGTITLGLYGKDAPLTVKNFLGLVRKKFYDGILFHRVAKNFVIQVGDPKTRDANARAEWGTGGETADGKPLPEELDASAPSAKAGYQFGVVAMARTAEPNSGTSQFFICLEKAAALPHQYTIFGRVIDGLKVVSQIGNVEFEKTTPDAIEGIPRKAVVIKSIRLRKLN